MNLPVMWENIASTLIIIDFATYDETAESDFGQSFLKQHNLLVLDARDSPAVGEV